VDGFVYGGVGDVVDSINSSLKADAILGKLE